MSNIDPKQIKIGMQVEKEHHKGEAETRGFVMDHLKEIPDYYTRLEKMEKAAPHINLEENKMNKNPILAAMKKKKGPVEQEEQETAAQEAPGSAHEKAESPKFEKEEHGEDDKKKKLVGALIALKMKKK